MYIIYVVLLFVASAINLSLAIVALRRIKTEGAIAFAWMMLGIAIHTFSAGYSSISSSIEIADFWLSKVRFIGVVFIPVALFLFTLSIDARKSLLKISNVALFCIIPVLTIIFAFTNQNHHLFIETISYQKIDGLIFRSEWSPGAWFWVHSAYSYILVLLSMGILFVAMLRKPHPYKGQAILLFAGVFVPMAANVVVLSKYSSLELTALCLTFSGIILGYALFRYRMLDIVPIARDNVVESIKDAVLVLDRQDRIVDLNPSARHMLNVDIKNVVGKKIQNIVPKAANLKKRLESRHLENLEMEFNGENGEKILFDLTISRLTNRRNAWVGTLIVARDITELKTAEKKLEKSEKRFRTLFENAPVAIRGFDLKGKIKYWNTASEKIYGYTKEEARGKSISELIVPPKVKGKVDSINANLVQTGSIPLPQEFLFKNKKNRPIPVLSTYTMVNLKDNESELYCLDVDMTEQKKLQNQILQTHKMDAIATLAGGIAHQFNNFLTVITGNLELLQSRDKKNKNLSAMAKSTEGMTKLTAQLLAFARGGKYYETIIDIKDLVTELLPLLKYEINPSLEIDTDFAQNICRIKGDHLQIQMVISAILKNASEAVNENGFIQIDCKNTRVEPGVEEETRPGLIPGDYAVLTITDNGRGMEKETQKRIFDPFFTTNFQGRGLGMAAVYGIVKNHKGFIFVESEPGRGTCVSLYLPKTDDPVREIQPEEIREPVNTSSNILLIEDEDSIIELIKEQLKVLGYDHVIEARSGKEAIDIAITFDGKIDLALLDILLPDMSGDTIFPILKNARPDLKVIVCSGYSISGPVQKILDAGAQDFLQKPFKIEELSEKLNRLLNA
jgi:two-component system cell cycle sensor histidine kinase/response regulator CckA